MAYHTSSPCALPTATLVDGLTQSAKTWKVFDLLHKDLPAEENGTVVLFVTQANSVTSVNQLLSRAQHDPALCAKFPLMCRAGPFSELFAEEDKENAVVVDFWNTKNTCAMIQAVKAHKKKIQRIVICIDEADQGHKKGLKTRLDFVRKIEKRSGFAKKGKQDLHLIFVTATVANLSKTIYALAEEHPVTYRRSLVLQRLLHDRCVQHCFVMPGPQYVGPSWYVQQDARMWRRLEIEPKNTHQNKQEYNAYFNDCINIQLDRLTPAQKRLTLIVGSTNTCDQRRLCEKMFMLDYNVIVELNSLNNKNYNVFYRSEGAIMKQWTIPFHELERLADAGRLSKVRHERTRRFVETGIESSLDLTLSYILQASLFMGTHHEDEIRANVSDKEWLRLYALMNAMTYSVKNTRPEDYPMESPRVAMIAGHLAGRGVTIQNPFLHFACTSFCFAGKKDTLQRGAQNSQKFGRACGMLSEIFVNKRQTPVLIASPDVVLDAHANEIALRQVSDEKEVCLKDLILRADWMRAMKASRETLSHDNIVVREHINDVTFVPVKYSLRGKLSDDEESTLLNKTSIKSLAHTIALRVSKEYGQWIDDGFALKRVIKGTDQSNDSTCRHMDMIQDAVNKSIPKKPYGVSAEKAHGKYMSIVLDMRKNKEKVYIMACACSEK